MISLFSLALLFARIGLFTYGGGMASLPFLYNAFVVETGWLTAQSFTEMTALAQMTPGPIVLNAATLLGYRFGGFVGSLVCTASVIAAPLCVVIALMVLLHKAKGTAALWVDRIRVAMRPVVAALLLASLWSIAQPVIHRPVLWPLVPLSLALWVKSKTIQLYPQIMLFLAGLLALGASLMSLLQL